MTEERGRLPRAAVWNLVDVVGRQVVQLGVVVLLARLLTPADFGLVAVAMLLVVVGSALSEGGVSVSLVQRETVTDDDRTASVVTNLVLGVVVTAVIVAAAGPLAGAFDEPRLRTLAMVMAPTVLFSALAATPIALLSRELDFRTVALAGVSGTAAGGTVAVVLALTGAGVYALGVQPVVSTAVNAAVLVTRTGLRLGRRPGWSTYRRLWSFGGWILAATMLEVAYSRLYAAAIGRTDGLRQVGLYARADQTQQLVSGILASLISRVSLPVLSRHGARSPEMRRSLQRGCTVLMGLHAPVIGLLGALATPFVVAVFGGQWSSAGPILTVLCVAAFYFPLQVVNVSYVIAAGRPRLYFALEVAKKVVGLPLLLVGASIGAIWVAWAAVVYAAAALVLNALPAQRMTGYGLLAQLRDTAGGVAVTLPVCVAVHLVSRAWSGAPALIETAVLGAAGVALVAAGYAVLRPACAAPLWDAWTSLRRRTSTLTR